MKAMILAAGRGERMKPLTDHMPKPLLSVGGKPLIIHHIEKLVSIGITDIIINTAYLGEKIQQALGNGEHWGATISYSTEPEPLETGGALLHALPLLGDEPFLLVNGDVWTDFNFSPLIDVPLKNSKARLVLVDNPQHNAKGDFSLKDHFIVAKDSCLPAYTFSGLGLFNPTIIDEYPEKRRAFPLREVFNLAIENGQLEGILYSGQWWDIGTPERLQQLDQLLS